MHSAAAFTTLIVEPVHQYEPDPQFSEHSTIKAVRAGGSKLPRETNRVTAPVSDLLSSFKANCYLRCQSSCCAWLRRGCCAVAATLPSLRTAPASWLHRGLRLGGGEAGFSHPCVHPGAESILYLRYACVDNNPRLSNAGKVRHNQHNQDFHTETVETKIWGGEQINMHISEWSIWMGRKATCLHSHRGARLMQWPNTVAPPTGTCHQRLGKSFHGLFNHQEQE
eukprot:6191534-Pleurochrysis_carterae.AAC.1